MRHWLNRLFRPRLAGEPRSLHAGSSAERIDAWMREAYALHQSGKLADAEDRYRGILREQPGHVDALFLLGELANRTGRHERAVELIGKAIAANGEVAVFHHELGSALRANGELARAEQSLSKALELDPDDLQARVDLGIVQLDQDNGVAAEQTFRDILRRDGALLVAHVNLAAALLAQRRFDEAESSLREALKLDPFCAQALSNLASISIKRADLAEAQRLLERALAIDPLCFEAKVNLSTVLLKQKRWEPALQILEEVVRAKPGRPEVHHNVGKVHLHLRNYAAATQAFRDALRLEPSRTEAHLDLGKALYETGQVDEALEHLRAAVRLSPELPMAHLALGHALETTGEFAQAMSCYERALALDPEFVQAHVNRAVLWILTGDFARGWPQYEWRLRTKELVAVYERFPIPRWDGSPLAGRTLLICSEQGLGDEIMYASCFPEVIATAGHCVIECAAKLEPLFRRSFPQATVRAAAKDDAANWLKGAPPIDVQIPAASLPLHLRREAAEFPRERAYLRAAADRVSHWGKRLAELGPGLKIGLSWRGGVPETGTTLRSLALEELLPLLRVPGARFVSLQYGDCRGELARLSQLHRIEVQHWQEAIDDYEETAALVCALDLTISVCTAVVHLGGALGRPVWVMAPVRPEARYGLQGETMPWYASVRMFRQPAYRDWESVIAKLARELAAFAR